MAALPFGRGVLFLAGAGQIWNHQSFDEKL